MKWVQVIYLGTCAWYMYVALMTFSFTCSALSAEPIMLKSLVIMLYCTAQEMCLLCSKMC